MAAIRICGRRKVADPDSQRTRAGSRHRSRVMAGLWDRGYSDFAWAKGGGPRLAKNASREPTPFACDGRALGWRLFGFAVGERWRTPTRKERAPGADTVRV